MSFGMSLYFHEFTSDVNLSIDFGEYIYMRPSLTHWDEVQVPVYCT